MLLFCFLLFGHWLADFTHLSQPYMLAAKKFGRPLTPIFHHALVHAILVMLILICHAADPYRTLLACLMMLVSHFTIDVWKGRMNVWFPSLQSPVNVFHWWIFGLDQMLHIVVLFLIYDLF